MAIWSLIMDRSGPKWARCRPKDSILRPTSLSWIQTMTIKGLSTSVTYFGLSHKPNNTVRSGFGLPPLSVKLTRICNSGPLVDQGRHSGGATGHQGLPVGEGRHSWASSMPTAISEFKNKLFHGPEMTAYLTFLVCVS